MKVRATFVIVCLAALVAVSTWLGSGREVLAGLHSTEPTPALGVFEGLSLDEARARAAEDERLLVVDLTATWCPPCRAMEATTWVAPDVQAWFDAHGVALQIDVDEFPDVARRFRPTAYPTVVVLREGREAGRVVGYKDAGQLLRWLEDLRAHRTPQPTRLQRGPMTYRGVPDTGPGSPMLRHMQASAALRAGRHAEALDELLWLWAHGLEHSPAFSGVRGSFVVGSIQDLVEQYPPARAAFADLLEQVQAEIEADRLSYERWGDWVGLCTALGETDRVHAWLESRRDADGHFRPDPLWDQSWLADSLFEMLVREGRWAEAGRLHARPSAAVGRRLSLFAMADEATRSMPGVVGGAAKALDGLGLGAAQDRGLRRYAARLHAAALAADRPGEARRSADLLMQHLDDAESRLALVRAALDHARPGADHLRWYAEAMAAGADVGDLPERLDAFVES